MEAKKKKRLTQAYLWPEYFFCKFAEYLLTTFAKNNDLKTAIPDKSGKGYLSLQGRTLIRLVVGLTFTAKSKF